MIRLSIVLAVLVLLLVCCNLFEDDTLYYHHCDYCGVVNVASKWKCSGHLYKDFDRNVLCNEIIDHYYNRHGLVR
jgi:hypothetical protein